MFERLPNLGRINQRFLTRTYLVILAFIGQLTYQVYAGCSSGNSITPDPLSLTFPTIGTTPATGSTDVLFSSLISPTVFDDTETNDNCGNIAYAITEAPAHLTVDSTPKFTLQSVSQAGCDT